MIKNQIVKKGKHKEIKARLKYSSFFMQSKIHLKIIQNTYDFMFSPDRYICNSHRIALTTLCNKSPLYGCVVFHCSFTPQHPPKPPTLRLSFDSTTPARRTLHDHHHMGGIGERERMKKSADKVLNEGICCIFNGLTNAWSLRHSNDKYQALRRDLSRFPPNSHFMLHSVLIDYCFRQNHSITLQQLTPQII